MAPAEPFDPLISERDRGWYGFIPSYRWIGGDVTRRTNPSKCYPELRRADTSGHAVAVRLVFSRRPMGDALDRLPALSTDRFARVMASRVLVDYFGEGSRLLCK